MCSKISKTHFNYLTNLPTAGEAFSIYFYSILFLGYAIIQLPEILLYLLQLLTARIPETSFPPFDWSHGKKTKSNCANKLNARNLNKLDARNQKRKERKQKYDESDPGSSSDAMYRELESKLSNMFESFKKDFVKEMKDQ